MGPLTGSKMGIMDGWPWYSDSGAAAAMPNNDNIYTNYETLTQ